MKFEFLNGRSAIPRQSHIRPGSYNYYIAPGGTTRLIITVAVPLRALFRAIFRGLCTYHHAEASSVEPRMAHDAIAGFQHALDLAARGARRQSLHRLAEVAKRAALLLPVQNNTFRSVSVCMPQNHSLL